MLVRTLVAFVAVLAVGCGGSTDRNGDAANADSSGGAGGSGGTGGNGSGGGGGATTSVTLTSSTTGTHCGYLDCIVPNCPDGRTVTLADHCCPICACDTVGCGVLDCPSSQTVTPPGECCPQCVDSWCSDVTCADPMSCGSERTYSRPDGACCSGCIPNEPVGCPDIECAPDVSCPKGYARGDLLGGCCGECLPDPLYCEVDDDCVLADRPRSCCGCPEVISRRSLDDDACWTPVNEPRPIPDECIPDAFCDRECGACPEPPSAVCLQNRCVALPEQQ